MEKATYRVKSTHQTAKVIVTIPGVGEEIETFRNTRFGTALERAERWGKERTKVWNSQVRPVVDLTPGIPIIPLKVQWSVYWRLRGERAWSLKSIYSESSFGDTALSMAVSEANQLVLQRMEVEVREEIDDK